MLWKGTLVILALLIAMQTLGGCSGQAGDAGNGNASVNAGNANANRAVEPGMDGAKDNPDELRTLIKLPYEPEDLVWKEFIAGKPGDVQGKRLLAVFQFTADDTRKLIDAASKLRPPAPIALSSEKWFPKELVTQAELSGEAGIQATSYAADEFLQPPFTEGTISRVDNTEFFVLELFAK